MENQYIIFSLCPRNVRKPQEVRKTYDLDEFYLKFLNSPVGLCQDWNDM